MSRIVLANTRTSRGVSDRGLCNFVTSDARSLGDAVDLPFDASHHVMVGMVRGHGVADQAEGVLMPASGLLISWATSAAIRPVPASFSDSVCESPPSCSPLLGQFAVGDPPFL